MNLEKLEQLDVDELRAFWTPSPVPPCPVCGGPLQLQAIGRGPIVWACSADEPDPTNPEHYRLKSGRSFVDEHYHRSRWIQPKRGNELALRLLNTYVAEIEVRQKATAEAEQWRNVIARAMTALAPLFPDWKDGDLRTFDMLCRRIVEDVQAMQKAE